MYIFVLHLTFKLRTNMIISKKHIMYAMAVWIFAAICYQEYKKNERISTMSVLEQVAMRPINGMDPIRIEDTDSTQAVSKIYEGLYAYHYLKRPFEIIPNLAEEMPIVSPDGLVYVIKIKKGVYFQDDACFPGGKGRELKASDFVYSLMRTADPTNDVPYVDLIKPYIQGLKEWSHSPKPDYAQKIAGLQALDDHTLQITLTKPYPPLLHVLVLQVAFVVPQEAVTHYGKEFINHPVGTGPFALPEGFNPQAKKIEFVKNPTFREKLFPSEAAPAYASMLAYAGKKLPLSDKIITHVLTEEAPRFLKFSRGEIDINRIDDSSFALDIVKEGVLTDPKLVKKGAVLEQIIGNNTQLFCFNHALPLFKNRLLRQAMALAFDRETYNQLFYNNQATTAQSIVPPSLLGEQATVVNPPAYNLEKAKECLAKAGYPAGAGLPVITLDVRSETTYKNQADFFAKCMEKIGIRIQVITNTYPELREKMFVKKAVMLYPIVWGADYPDASSMLQVISTDVIRLQYNNPAFNALFAQASTHPNKEMQQALYQKLNQMVADEVPVICTVHKPLQFLRHKWVKNFIHNGFEFSMDQYIAVDLLEKKKTLT
jgi:ABC-type transport system substrate-binding protein